MPLSRALRFETERFDYRSPPPEAANAGNRFHGRDVAEFLAQGLAARGLEASFLDEDWGWLVEAAGPGAEVPFEVAIYNLADAEGEPAPAGTADEDPARPGGPRWGLWVRAFRRRKVLGLFERRVECEVPGSVVEAVAGPFAGIGVTLAPWPDGPA